MWCEVGCAETENILVQNFWSGLRVWIQRPHILNRRIFSIDVLETLTITCRSGEDKDVWSKAICSGVSSSSFYQFKNNLIKTFDVQRKDFLFSDDEVNSAKEVFIQVRKVLPRCSKFGPVTEVLLLSGNRESVAFVPFDQNKTLPLLPAFPYKIELINGRINMSAYLKSREELEVGDASVKWLRTVVLKKIQNWSNISPKSTILQSLSHVSTKNYSLMYNDLKEKYAKKLIEMWPESTDPLKFVYEDIAIAAYLMTFWEQERSSLGTTKKQSFVDLGCGNGLLVYILSSEGYPGIGIDVRRRNIWDLFQNVAKLVEQTVLPSDAVLFPEYDWIIGNHSDELTPWIPVIAARSSYGMKAFLLPCCPFTFNGKYERQSSAASRYESYLEFIHKLCQEVGFNVHRDKLRIPSTKRVCFVCHCRNYKPEEEEIVDKQRSDFIQKHSCEVSAARNVPACETTDGSHVSQEDEGADDLQDSAWLTTFKPRDKVEAVRNCGALNQTFINQTVVTVLNLLLQEKNVIEIQEGGKILTWNSGGSISLPDVAAELGRETLQQLKRQFGGLQTLLKNHKNVFRVEKGNVMLRNPLEDTTSFPFGRRKKKWKAQKSFAEKPCIFHFNHPDGCPFSASKCMFSHEMTK